MAKGFAADAVAAQLTSLGSTDHYVQIGGDIATVGTRPWRVAIEQPSASAQLAQAFDLTGQSLSTSGDAHNSFTHAGRRYGHILDPRTGWPVKNGMRAVTVVANTCLQAGIYSTAVFVLGARDGLYLASLARDVEVCAQSEHGIEGSRGFGKWLVQAA
jgi:thiamine biosynthesis lipoprotein